MSLKTAPYGTWQSPISAESLFVQSISFDNVLVDEVTGKIYLIESRPSEDGRSVVVDTATGTDLVGPGWNVRTGVQEYGGGPAIVYNGILYFSHFVDNRVYAVKSGEEPKAITPDNKNHRFADFDVYPSLNGSPILVAILEDHTKPAPADVVTSLVIIDVDTSTVSQLVSGIDFYSSPRFSPDGTRLAWQQWSHPDMPWEGSEIFVADVHIQSGSASPVTLDTPIHVAGKKGEISAAYPTWTKHNTLFFTSDEGRLRFQNPWAYASGTAKALLKEPLDQDFGQPQWFLGWQFGAALDDAGKFFLFSASKEGRDVLQLVDASTGTSKEIDGPYAEVVSLRRAGTNKVAVVGQSINAPTFLGLVTFDEGLNPSFVTIRSTSSGEELSEGLLAKPQPITLNIPGNELCHVIYYAPTNPDYSGTSIEGEKPPCVVGVHGGPTFRTGQGLDKAKQFWTSRGWGWLDVNYGGSSGYGRDYIDRLKGQWGVVDVADCVVAVQLLSLAPYSLIDPRRLAIRGGSAGGYTVLQALTHPDPEWAKVWAAGTSMYGISDLRGLVSDTHKFESQYMYKLMGGTLEEIPEVYEERSPVEHADRIVAPLLILQGLLDAVVPPAQANVIVQSIEDRHGQVKYVPFEGEGHGWRKAETKVAALNDELAWYQDVLGLKQSE
ncbi:alpha/beta-hydrolase [Punctularia strigosozonata HHB-11173 SS5]|uniref:Alpha/beta-hydrolase n=1 Tax=Punctularia strigosozonata (strain HHB-11173) TaxID=741275 RepID=R7S3I4_PUNST|nr:alpha/beta-hydrolase [Punctularia strigosozonata HHB-11173 SS5]EIN04429.1 alpha/beta-hydrolase [Punctularia strigosozonata HHB-11173 SS5]